MESISPSQDSLNQGQSTEAVSKIEQLLKIDFSTHSKAVYTFINFVLIIALIVAGFGLKPEEILTAENGWGYALGIIGGSMMLLLIIYPIRKRMKTARYLGSVRFWFKTHMLFGVAGPIAILYHSNFSLGSMNSTIALACMLIVAASGFIGRYLYSQIHNGLYGKKASLAGILKNIEEEEGKLAVLYKITPELKDELVVYQSALKTSMSLSESLVRFFVIGTKIRIANLVLPFKLKSTVMAHAKNSQWTPLHTRLYWKMLKIHIRYYLLTTLKVCEFTVYERLFALWHTLHLPLFIMMILTGIIHVIAVHMY